MKAEINKGELRERASKEIIYRASWESKSKLRICSQKNSERELLCP